MSACIVTADLNSIPSRGTSMGQECCVLSPPAPGVWLFYAKGTVEPFNHTGSTCKTFTSLHSSPLLLAFCWGKVFSGYLLTSDSDFPSRLHQRHAHFSNFCWHVQPEVELWDVSNVRFHYHKWQKIEKKMFQTEGNIPQWFWSFCVLISCSLGYYKWDSNSCHCFMPSWWQSNELFISHTAYNYST